MTFEEIVNKFNDKEFAIMFESPDEIDEMLEAAARNPEADVTRGIGGPCSFSRFIQKEFENDITVFFIGSLNFIGGNRSLDYYNFDYPVYNWSKLHDKDAIPSGNVEESEFYQILYA